MMSPAASRKEIGGKCARLIAFLLLGTAGCSSLSVAAPSFTVLFATPAAFPFAESLVEAYRQSYPDQPSILVNSGSLDEAWNDYAKGLTQAVVECDETNAQYPTSSLGWAAIALVTASDRSHGNLSRTQVRSLFLGMPGESDASASAGTAHLFVYPAESGLQGLFNRMVLDGRQPYSGATVVPSAAALATALESDPSGVGFMACIDVPSQLTVSSVEGAYPDYESVVKGKYPFRVPILIRAKSDMPSVLKTFIGWAQSINGQAVLSRACPSGGKS